MKEIKCFNVRLPKELWAFLKKLATQNETNMSEIVRDCIEQLKKNHEKKVDK